MKKGINKTFLLAALITSLASFLHLYRVVFSLDLVLGNWFVPMWLSILAVFLAGYLAVYFWKNLIK